jgi:hypothetical protein
VAIGAAAAGDGRAPARRSFSARARQAVFLQAHGHSRTEIAALIGVAPETISVWKRHPQDALATRPNAGALWPAPNPALDLLAAGAPDRVTECGPDVRASSGAKQLLEPKVTDPCSERHRPM